MKKFFSLFSFIFLLSTTLAFSADDKTKQFNGHGEVTSVDPLYSRITIRHEAIRGFSGSAETEFFVSSPALLKSIQKRDLVDFVIVEKNKSAQIEKITKTGQAPIHEEKLEVGKAVQGVLVATGEVAKSVTTPIPPAHEVVSGTVGAATSTTGAVLDEADGTKVKTKF